MRECVRLLESVTASLSGRLILLPIPTTRDNIYINGTDLSLGSIVPLLTSESTLVGYNIPRDLVFNAEQVGAAVYDAGRDERFLMENAIISARGAIGYLLTSFTRDVADMKIGKLKVRLFHGKGSNAYAKSYKIQKYLDTIPTEELPDILQTGHIHQAFYYKQNKTHCFQTSCLEDQTPFARSMGLSNDKSVWWVDVYMDDNGRPIKVEPVLEEFGKKLVRKK